MPEARTPLPVDDWAPLELVDNCDPVVRPGVDAFAEMVVAHLGGSKGRIVARCDDPNPTSKHRQGRAWDWFPPSKSIASEFAAALVDEGPSGELAELARRAGLRTIIWNRRIWNAAHKSSAWSAYSGPSPHTDHIHFGFGWDGAEGRTSLYSIIEGTGELVADVEEQPSIIGAKGIENTSHTFRRRLLNIAEGLGLSADLMACVMSFETAGTFSPKIRNPHSGFVGLIQWGPPGAGYVGTTVQALSSMGAVEQLEYVRRWFAKVPPRRIVRPVDYYLSVFAPAGIGKPWDHVMYPAGSRAYAQNAAMDADGDGNISVGDINAKWSAFVAKQEQRPRVSVGWAPELGSVPALVGALAAAAGVGYAAKRSGE